MRRPLLCLAVLAAVAAARAEAPPEAVLRELAKGNLAPLTVTPKQLDGNWFVFRPSGPEGLTDLILMDMSESDLGLDYYSLGQTVMLGADLYLVAYRQPMTAGRHHRDAPPLTAETSLVLSLLKVSQIGHLQDIRRFDPRRFAPVATGAPADSEELRAASLNNLKQLGVACMMYAQDYDEVMPPLDTPAVAMRALLPYARSEQQLFVQPGTNQPYLTNPLLSRRKMAHISNPWEMILFYEAKPAADGSVGAVFMDGHARRTPQAEWPMTWRRSRLNEVAPQGEPGFVPPPGAPAPGAPAGPPPPPGFPGAAGAAAPRR